MNVIHLSHPETILLVNGKIVLHETGPCCQKGCGLLISRSYICEYLKLPVPLEAWRL